MIVRGLDSNGDWLFGKGQNDYLANQNAAQQLIQTRLLSFAGNCFFAQQDGVPWFSYLGTSGAQNATALNLAVTAVILNTKDSSGQALVTGIQQLSINLNRRTRNLSISYQVITIYSVVTGSFSYDVNGIT